MAALLLAGCTAEPEPEGKDDDYVGHAGPQECSTGGGSFSAPYAADDLRNLAWVDAETAEMTDEQKTFVLESASPRIQSFHGRKYDWSNVKFYNVWERSNSTESTNEWVFTFEGNYGQENTTDFYEFAVTMSKDSEDIDVWLARASRGGLEPSVRDLADRVARSSPDRGEGIQNSSYLRGATWGPTWPLCVRLEYVPDPPPLYTSDPVAIAFVDVFQERLVVAYPPTPEY